MLMDTANAKDVQTEGDIGGISAGLVSALVLVVLGLGVGALLVVARSQGDQSEAAGPFWATDDEDVAAVVDAVIDEI
jgi:hypothetical protein